MLPTITSILLVFVAPVTSTLDHSVLVLQLGSPSYREREAASNHLELLGISTWEALQQGTHSPDAEIVARCRRLLASMWQVSGNLPWLDMAHTSMNLCPWQSNYLYQAGRCGWVSRGPGWDSYREATRFWVMDLRKAGITNWAITGMLDIMRHREGEYQRRVGIDRTVH